jgi:hypothetical protein
MVRNMAGEEVISSAFVILPANTSIGHKDKISYDGKDYTILTIEKKKDFSDRSIIISLA